MIMKRVLPICLTLLAAGALNSVVGTPARTHFQDGQSSIASRAEPSKSNDVDSDSAESSEDLRQRQKRAKTFFKQGVDYGLAGRFLEAVDAFKRTIALDRGNANAYFGLGHAYSDLGRWSEAVTALTEATRLNPQDAEAHHKLGIAYFKQEQYEEATAAFRRAVLLMPKWADVRYNLGNAFFRMRRFEPAVVHYLEVLHFKPELADAHNDLGIAYAELRRLDLAIESFQRAVRANSDDPYARHNLALTHYLQGRHDQAVKEFQKALRLAPDDEAIRVSADLAGTALATQGGAVGERVAIVKRDAPTGNVDVKFNDAPVASRWLGRSLITREGELKELGRSGRTSYTPVASPIAATPSSTSSASVPTESAATTKEEPAVKAPPVKSPSPPRLVVRSNADDAADKAQPGPSTVNRTAAVSTGATSNIAAANDAPVNTAPASTGAMNAEPVATKSTSAVPLTNIYRVGVGDVLDIRLLNTTPDDDSTLYTVLSGGLLEYDLAGPPVTVAGLTTDEIKARLTSALKQRAVHENPEIIVSVRDHTSHNVIVSGLVAEPGNKVLRREAIPLYVVIADARPQPDAGRASIISHHTGRTTQIDLDDEAALGTLVYPGDVINVTQSQPRFYYIGGEVNEPGQKPFHAGITLTQAILASGGILHTKGGGARDWTRTVLTAGAASSGRRAINVTRQNSEGRLSTVKYELQEIMSGKVPDPLIQVGDRIEVGR